MTDDGTKDIEPPERRRRVAILCCNFMRNLALHRAGLRADVGEYLLNPNHPTQGEFWIQAHGNFLDTSVLEWWKLFADYDGKHHWHRVVGDSISDRKRFGEDLYATGVSRAGFKKTIKEVDDYRNEFVGHLDDKRDMDFPDLEVAKQATLFLYERHAQMTASAEEWRSLPASAEELALVYERASAQAKSVYDEAVRAAHRL
jgi:hypothetical protein